MSSPDLKAMARWLESSNPSDRDEQAWLLNRMHELRDAIATELDADLHACLQASIHLLEALSSHGEHFPCDAVGTATRTLIESIDASLSARTTGVAAPALESMTAPEELPAEPVSEPTPESTPQPHHEVHLVRDPEAAPETQPQTHPEARSEPELRLEPTLESTPVVQPEPEVDPEDIELDWTAKSESEELVVADSAAVSAEATATLEEFPECNDQVLGKMLIELGHVTREQVASALKLHRSKKLRLGECLLLQGATSPDRVLSTLKIQDRLRGSNNAEKSAQQMEVEVTCTPLRRSMPKKTDGPPPKPAALHVTEKMFLGEVLLGAEMITNEQLEEAMHRHHHDGVRVGEALVQMGALTEEEIQSGLALHESLRSIAGLTASTKQVKR